jgi:hypothetical protein
MQHRITVIFSKERQHRRKYSRETPKLTAEAREPSMLVFKLVFADRLHAALKHKGINVFRDDEKLERGKNVSEGLLKAIQEAMYMGNISGWHVQDK